MQENNCLDPESRRYILLS